MSDWHGIACVTSGLRLSSHPTSPETTFLYFQQIYLASAKPSLPQLFHRLTDRILIRLLRSAWVSFDQDPNLPKKVSTCRPGSVGRGSSSPAQRRSPLCCSRQPPSALSGFPLVLQIGSNPDPNLGGLQVPLVQSHEEGASHTTCVKPTTACSPRAVWQHANDLAEASLLPLHALLTWWISFCSCSEASHHLHVLRGRCCVEDKTTFCSAPVKCN